MDELKKELSAKLLVYVTEHAPTFQLPKELWKEAQLAFGDLTTTLPLQLAKATGQNPLQLAGEMAQLFTSNAYSVQVVPPGYINVTLHDTTLDAIVQTQQKKPVNGKTAIVEFSSPNIAKPFTIGHLRSTIIGNAVANLLKANGWNVLRDNHVGDWGTQFGKQIYALQHIRLPNNTDNDILTGNIAILEASQSPVKDLVWLYQAYHTAAEKDNTLDDTARAYFLKLEQGDKEMRRLWQLCIDWSWEEFDRIYRELGIRFSPEFNNGRGLGEAFFEDKMQDVVIELAESGYMKEGEESAQVFFFPHDELPPLIIVKKDGSSIYATRDLATDKYRIQHYHPDLIVNEVGAEQSLYFQQIYTIEKLLGWFEKGQRVHVKHALYRFKDGKMSTRKGNVIWLEEVLSEARERAKAMIRGRGKSIERIEFTAIAIGALIWNDLKKAAHLDTLFDWEEILSMEGNSGPYMQYAFVRCQSILKKEGTSTASHLAFTTDNERMLARKLIRFSTAVSDAAEHYAPHILCNYLYNLAQEFSSFYESSSIKGSSDETKQTRLFLVQKTAQTLQEGLRLLGIQTVEEM